MVRILEEMITVSAAHKFLNVFAGDLQMLIWDFLDYNNRGNDFDRRGPPRGMFDGPIGPLNRFGPPGRGGNGGGAGPPIGMLRGGPPPFGPRMGGAPMFMRGQRPGPPGSGPPGPG